MSPRIRFDEGSHFKGLQLYSRGIVHQEVDPDSMDDGADAAGEDDETHLV